MARYDKRRQEKLQRDEDRVRGSRRHQPLGEDRPMKHVAKVILLQLASGAQRVDE